MKKNTIKILVSILLFFTLAAPSYSKGVYILCYHAFLEKKDPYSFTLDQFRDQLHRLKNNGFTFVAFEDVVNDRVKGNKNILITIDDGNHSVYEAYYSVMKPMGIKPVLGIYPAIISRMEYAMTWDQVKKLAADGCYIASHGYHHMFLTTKYYNKDQASFKKEIYLSKKILEEKLNRKIDTMLYPFGETSDIAISELKNAGYKYGMTIIPKITQLPVNDNFHINRYLMTKPGQKGIIASISKQAESASTLADNSQGTDTTSQKIEEKNIPEKDKISVIKYPEIIKKIMTDNSIFMPAVSETKKKKNVKFKPFIHKSKTTVVSKNKIKSKKITTKSEKKNRRKKKTA